jgi:hypothetical protein
MPKGCTIADPDRLATSPPEDLEKGAAVALELMHAVDRHMARPSSLLHVFRGLDDQFKAFSRHEEIAKGRQGSRRTSKPRSTRGRPMKIPRELLRTELERYPQLPGKKRISDEQRARRLTKEVNRQQREHGLPEIRVTKGNVGRARRQLEKGDSTSST